MAGMSTYTATASRWDHGWQYMVDGVGATQSRTLATGIERVRDLIETVDGVDPATVEVDLRIDLGGLEDDAERARELVLTATRLQREAAAASRESVAELRAAGLSLADIGTMLRMSPARVSQLARSRRA
jgi:Fe-S-cluster formation regulator IscX/YfhJ